MLEHTSKQASEVKIVAGRMRRVFARFPRATQTSGLVIVIVIVCPPSPPSGKNIIIVCFVLYL